MAAGDVVNTAARLQAAAPVNGVLVGETTYRATRDVDRVRESRAGRGEGEAEPIAVWEAVAGALALRRSTSTRPPSPLVGRERELGVLLDAFERARSERAAAARDARRRARASASAVSSPSCSRPSTATRSSSRGGRAGRCPTATASASGRSAEMVKAQAGILETDSAGRGARRSCARPSSRLVRRPRTSATGSSSHLRPLVGLERGDGGGDRRRGVRRLAPLLRGPGRTSAARARLRGSALGRRRAARLRRPSRRLGDAACRCWSLRRPARSCSTGDRTGAAGSPTRRRSRCTAVARGDRAARPRAARPGRCSRPRRSRRCSSAPGATRCTPSSSRASVRSAARRDDSRSRDGPGDHRRAARRALAGGEAAAPGRRRARQGVLGGARPRIDARVDEHLHALERKEFLRRERRSAVGGETQYAFRHVLVRDVAYGQIPRARAARSTGARPTGSSRWAAPTTTPSSSRIISRPRSSSVSRSATGRGSATGAPASARERWAPGGGPALLRSGARVVAGRR